ncbi:uncharacterized protein LOC142767307 [Rhipicephalus microplus]|uniref:uncharacterized protein LOC142767307 n=1 Tax=Rhipicephalus microplus TaxID=6941 RepID=UPI003F6D267E
MASWPMLPYTSSSRQLSSLVKVGSAFFLVRACLPCSASPLRPVGLARARIFQVWTMDVDRAASLAIPTSLRTPNCSCTATVQLHIYRPAAALRFGSSKILTLDILSRSTLGPRSRKWPNSVTY